MPVVFCDNCGCEIDPDQDSDYLVPDPRHSIPAHPDLILCQDCRERDDMPDEPPDPQGDAIDRARERWEDHQIHGEDNK